MDVLVWTGVFEKLPNTEVPYLSLTIYDFCEHTPPACSHRAAASTASHCYNYISK